MAESNPTQVILTDDGIKIIKAQNTADNAASGVTNLNDPNLMSVIEKQYNISQFAGLTSQYNAIVQSAKDDGIDTNAITTAYNNLNRFMADILADPNHASDIDRVTYKKYQDAYNGELAKIQNALQNNANDKFASAASASSQAALATSQAFSAADSARKEAQRLSNEADLAIKTQTEDIAKFSGKVDSAAASALSAEDDASSAVAKALSAAADSKDAKQIAGAVSQSYKTLTDGSTMTIAELQNGLGAKLTKSDLNGYATQDWAQNQIKFTADGINETLSSVKSTVNSHVTSINDLQTDSKKFKAQFTTFKDSIDRHDRDIGTLKADSKSFSSSFDSLSGDNKTNQHNISQLQQTAKEFSNTLETVQTQVQDSSVGTNLLTNTGTDYNPSFWSDNPASTYSAKDGIVTVSSKGKSVLLSWQQGVPLTAGDHIVLSVDVKGTGNISSGYHNGDDFEADSPDQPVNSPDTWKRIFFKRTIISVNSQKAQGFGFNPKIGSEFQLRRPKVEKGLHATDWSLNPSDNATVTAVSKISQTVDSIKTTVDKKVDNQDYQSFKDQTAKDISSAVKSKDFESYKTQLSGILEDKVSSKDYKSDKKQTDRMISDKISDAFSGLTISNRNLALGTATPFKMTGNNTEDQSQVAYEFSSVIPRGTIVTASFDVASTTGVGKFLMQFFAPDSGSSWQGIANGDLVKGTKHVSVTLTTEANHLHAFFRLDYATGDVTVSNFIISESSKEVSWTPAPEDQATQSEFTMLKNNIDLSVTKEGLISEINLQAHKTLISSGGQLTLSGKTIYFDTDNPVIIPSANIDTLLVGKELKTADISANTFKTNNGTFTVESDGAITAKNMTLIGGTLTSPIINTSTINGATINGTTFNAGDRISDSNNTRNFYPFTIEPTGKASTTLFNSMDALRTEMSGGGLRTMYRATNSSGSQYEAYDGNFSGDTISLNSGFTNGKDMSFSQSVSGNQLTGQVILSPLNGIHLWGSTQAIHFSGLQMNGTGITINSYGNILADQGSTWWRVVDFYGKQIAGFGSDVAGSNPIQFNRNLNVGNIKISTAHTISTADNGDIYFSMDKGGGTDIHAGAVHYTSLVKSSLLSVKKDVKKANTAYWAQLVNSIDLATYQYKTDDNTSQIRMSSIVDDVNDTKQWQLPDVFISRDEDGKLCGVDDSVLLNATLATVQEQQKEIDQLNGHNMELEARLNKLEAKLNG
ncbi:hypothetical protein [Lactiplantibacillus plantarum]|uniref:hypothetical protein n=1 Tax=Lactiplantibacillus plantarum TaxID=1590 RepID=UPI000B2FD6EB|nr:hypothetical protein [Lactiplantibacillus plantarum]